MKNSEMFNLLHKSAGRYLLVMLFVGGIFLLNQSFANWDYDVNLGVSDYLKKYLAQREQKAYLNSAYDSNFALDPFANTLETIQGKNTELILGGLEEITSQLQKNTCSLTQKQISTILYYFDDGFRSEMNYLISQGSNQYLRKTPGRTEMEKACGTYVTCYYLPGTFDGDVVTDCKSKMLSRYNKGYQKKHRFQRLETIQVGKDKYWNSSLEDSPYDLMYDLSAISKILFEDVQAPTEVLFYHMPNFSNNSSSSNASNGGNGNSAANSSGASSSGASSSGASSSGASSNSNQNSSSNGSSGSIASNSSDGGGLSFAQEDNEFSDFLEGNYSSSSSSSSTQSTLFGGNICMGVLDEITDSSTPTTSPSINVPVTDDISDEEYEEYIEDMKDQLDDYLELTEEDLPTTGTDLVSGGDALSGDIEDLLQAVEEVKSCYASCEGLRVDKKAACMTMCTCGEWVTPRFDPYETPGLGPIMKVKFCAVPVSAKNFSQNGVYVYSIESIFNELHGVVDTLDRGGELGIFEKQQEFLDLPASNMNFGKMITFSMDQSVQQKLTTNSVSEHFEQEMVKAQNRNMKETLGISSSLENPVSLNDYTVVQNPNAVAASNTFSASNDYQKSLKEQQALNQTLTQISDMQQSLFNERYTQLGALLYGFTYQHFMFWVDTTTTLQEFGDIAYRLSLK